MPRTYGCRELRRALTGLQLSHGASPATGALFPPGPSSASTPGCPAICRQRSCQGQGQRAGELLHALGLG